MKADEILKKHEDANEMHFHEVDRKWIVKAMKEYANQQLQLGGVSKCEKSCKNCKYLNGPNKKCIDCDDNYNQWEKSNIC